MSREQVAAVSDDQIISMARVSIRRRGDFNTARIAELCDVSTTKVRRVLRAADRNGGLGRTCVTVLSSGRRCGAPLPREAWGRLMPRCCAAHTAIGVVSPPVAPAESIADAGTGEAMAVVSRSRVEAPRMPEPGIPSQVATPLDVLKAELVEGELRVSATDIAQVLGFERPRNVLKLVKSNQAELAFYGGIRMRSETQRMSIGNGATREQEVSTPWLNREQALALAAMSKAPNAARVREVLIKAFVQEQDRVIAEANGGSVRRRGFVEFPPHGSVPAPALDSGLAPIVAELVRSQQQTTQALAGIAATLAALAAAPAPNAPITRAKPKPAAPDVPSRQLGLGAYAPAFDVAASAAAKGDWLSVSDIAATVGLPMETQHRERSKTLVVRWLKKTGHWHDRNIARNVGMVLDVDGHKSTRDHWVYAPQILDGASALRRAVKILRSLMSMGAKDAFTPVRQIIETGADRAA